MKYAVALSQAKTDAQRQQIKNNIAKDSYILTRKASTCETEQQCKVVLYELQRYFAQFNGIASAYEKNGNQQEKKWASFLREQQKETLSDIEKIGKKLVYLSEVKSTTNNSKVKNYSSKPTTTVIFKSGNGKVWNDGREAAGMGQPGPDYVAIQVAAATIYIPLYGTPNIYSGGSIARDEKLKPSYGFSVRFGEIQTEDDEELVKAGVYHPSTKWYPNKRARIVNDFLLGASGSVGGCVVYACVNKVNTLPQDIRDKSQTAYEYGIGAGFGGISPYSFNFEGGATGRVDTFLENLRNQSNTGKVKEK